MSDTPSEKSVRSEPLGDDGEVVVQQNVGPGSEDGGGEFPDKDAPPDRDAGAPG